jgi:radical SAM protein with 4Fe4S-binding SPASM domain
MPIDAVRIARAGDVARPHPIYCVWEITLACDLGCKHCGSRAGKPRRDELTTAQALDVVTQLHEAGVRDVVLIGGEAYLRDDWTVIARALADRDITVNMTTGARNLTPERIRQAVDAGLSSISISIDGLPRTHDAVRGVRGTFAAATAAARAVAATTLQLSVNTQINRLSMPELPDVARLLVELGARAWQIQLTVAMGRAADRPDLLLQPYELLELFPMLVEIKDTILEPNRIALFPANNIGYFGPYEHRIRAGGADGRHWSGCPAGQWAIGIEADGKLKGCPSLPTAAYAGGNLARERLVDLLERAPELRVLRERTRADLWGHCGTCYYADVCKGGCSWTAHSLLGRPGNNPYCIHRAMQLAKQGRRERVVQVAVAPGAPFDHGRFEIVEEDASTPLPRRVALPLLSVRAAPATR